MQNNSTVYRAFCLLFILVGAVNINAQKIQAESAKQLILKSAAAMGGLEKLQNVKNLKFKANGHHFLLEQSERPAGPWIVEYSQITEWRDLQNGSVRQERNVINPGEFQASPSTIIVANNVSAFLSGQTARPFSVNQVEETEENLALAPERLLLTALAAPDLHIEKDGVLQDVPHKTIAFNWKSSPVRIFLNADTNLPTAVEIVRARPFDVFWNVWGDFPVRTYFSFWTLEKNGLHYPHQWDAERNNQPFSSLLISEVEINADVPADAFKISPEVKQAFTARGNTKVSDWKLGLPNAPAIEIAPGLVQIPGRWNVALIKQTDGIVILEAPISSDYSAKVIAEATRRFPNVPIKAVISTADAFPHFGGLREYAARGIPIYLLDVNQPLVNRLLDASYRTFPDALAKTPRQAKIKSVKSKTIVGAGDNRLEIYPIRSETGERMMMVYAPAQHLLYGSDLVQPQPDGNFAMPQYVSELIDAAVREKLEVEKVFAMHSAVRSWKSLTEAVEQSKN